MNDAADRRFGLELRRHVLALAKIETDPAKRRALENIAGAIARRYRLTRPQRHTP